MEGKSTSSRPPGAWKDTFSQKCRSGDLDKIQALLLANDVTTCDKEYALCTSSAYGMHRLVATILESGVDPNAQCEQDGMAALHRAANNGHMEVVSVLIAADADVNSAARDGSTPLHLASRGGHIPAMDKLLSNEADVNCQTADGSTALHFASRNGHSKVVQLLVDASAQVGMTTKELKTPLHYASVLGSLDIIDMLLEAGASPCVADQEGFTPLHIAAKHGHSGVLEILIAGGAYVWDLTKSSETVLHLCAENGNSAAASVLLHASKERDVKNKTRKKWSTGAAPSLERVVSLENDQRLELEESYYLHLLNKDGKSALHLAVMNNRYSLAQDLLLAAASPKLHDADKNTPLHCAVEKNNVEIIKLLLRHGASLDAKNSNGETALNIAERKHGSRAVAVIENASTVMKLLRYGTCPCEDVTIAVGGAPGAGKTTFVNSFNVKWMRSLIRYEGWRDKAASNLATRTRGIRLVSGRDMTTRPPHTKHFLDLGGHEDFIPAHSVFLTESSTPSISVILVDGRLIGEQPTLITRQIEQWCGVFVSCNRELPRRYKKATLVGAEDMDHIPDRRMPVVVIVSRGESLDQRRQDMIWEQYKYATRTFQQYLDFDRKPHFIDCRKSQSEGMTALRARITDISVRLMTQAGEQPKMVQAIRKALPAVRKQIGAPFSQRPAFTAALLGILKQDSKLPNAIDFSGTSAQQDIVPALRILSCCGELVTFQSPLLKETIVIEPEWLLTTIVGQLCSPSFFPDTGTMFHGGRADKKYVVESLTAPKQPGNLVLDMLAQLGLCVVEQDQVIVPAKLPPLESRHAQIGNWQHVQALCEYAGARFSCQESIPLSAGFVILLQTRTYTEFRQKQSTVSKLWLRGVTVKPCVSHVQGTLMIHPTRLSVDAVVRGPKNSQREMFALLHILCELITGLAEQYSPGTVLTKLILSPGELQNKVIHPTLAYPGITYRADEVQRALYGNQVVEHEDGEVSDLALSLLHLPPTHIHLMSPQSHDELCDALDTPSTFDWRHTAERLGFKPMDIRPFERACGSKTKLLLRQWAMRSPNNTTERLLHLQENSKNGNLVAAKILREELQKPFLGTPNIFEVRRQGRGGALMSHALSFVMCSTELRDESDMDDSDDEYDGVLPGSGK